MSENTSRFNNESEQMPLDATEASDFLAHSITSRLQRMTLSPWLQRALQSDAETGGEGSGGILGRFGRRTAVSTQHTLTMVNRVEQTNERSLVWRADVGSIEPAIEGFTDKIVGRFATTESKYLVQKAEEEGEQPKQGQNPDMVFADYGGTSGSPTTGTPDSPPARRGAFDVNTLPEIPEHIKAQHLANRAASSPASSGPISLSPSAKSGPAKPAVPQRPLTPEERRKMRLYSRVEYVTPGSGAPETPQAHPLAEPTKSDAQSVAPVGAETPTAANPMPELPPGLTPVSEPVEEPKWRTRPRARVDYLTPRGDSPKSAEESAPSPIEEASVEAASEETLSPVSAESVQREEDEELTLRPRSRHRETPDSSEGEEKVATPSAESVQSAPVQREEQPETPTTVPSEETVPQAAKPVQPTVAAPQPEQRVQPTPSSATEQAQQETPTVGPVSLQRESAAPEALDLPLHPRQRQREAQEESPAADALPAALAPQSQEATPPSAAPEAQRQAKEATEPSADAPQVQRQVERPTAPDSKVAEAPKKAEPTATRVEAPHTEERPTPSVQRQTEAEQPLDMPLRPRARPSVSSESDATPSVVAEPHVARSDSEESEASTPTPRVASSAPQEPTTPPAQPVEAKREGVQAAPPAASVSEESAARGLEVAKTSTAPQPIQRQVAAEEELDLPLRPRTRPRKVQAEATDAPSVSPTPRQPEAGAEEVEFAASEPSQSATPVQRQAENVQPAPTAPVPSDATPVQRQAEGSQPSPTTPVQRQEEATPPLPAQPVQRQAAKPEAVDLPLRPRGRRVASQPTPDLPTVEQASFAEPSTPSVPVARPEEAPSVSRSQSIVQRATPEAEAPSGPTVQRAATEAKAPTTPIVQRAATEAEAPTTPAQPSEAAQASLPASLTATARPDVTSAPVTIERQVEGAFEVPELPLRVRPRFQAAPSDEEMVATPERLTPRPSPSLDAPSQAAPAVAAATEQGETTETTSTPQPTPVRAQARKSSPASQKAVQRKVAQATERGATPKAPTVQRQPTRTQAMPLRPRRRVTSFAATENEVAQPPIESGTQPAQPTVRRAEVGQASQPTSQPVRIQRVQRAQPALPLHARTPQRLIVEEAEVAEEQVATMSEPTQPLVAQPTDAPVVQRAVESVAAASEVERPTAAPVRSESVQRAERVERSTEPTPSLPLRAMRRRQPEAADELAASPLAEDLIARLAAQSQLPLNGPQGARAQRVVQPNKPAAKPARPKATRVQREPAKETNKVVAQRARPAVRSHEEATSQLAMAGWRFKRNAGSTANDPGLISRSMDNLVQRSDTGRPLDSGTRATMEGALGRDFSQVRVHNVQLSPLNVQAASEGRNVYFEPGKDRFDTPESLSLLGHELTHVAQSGFAQTKSVVQTAILPQARVQRSEAADEAEADQGEQSVMEYLRRPQMAQLMPLVNEAPAASSPATVQRAPLSSSHTDMPVVQRVETGGEGGGGENAAPTEASGGEEGKKDEKDPAEKAKELTKLARQLYPLIKRMLMVERERHSGI